MDAIEDIQRAVHWPEISSTHPRMTDVMNWLKTYQAKHLVYLPQGHFTGQQGGGMQAWLEERYGPAMIKRDDTGRYFWTNGRWVSMVVLSKNQPNGRNYLFMREEEAIEFKMRWL